MKRIQRNFLFFLFFSLMLTACNEKEEEDTEEKIACLTITEATGSGEERVTTEQKFIYEDGKLTRHITKQTLRTDCSKVNIRIVSAARSVTNRGRLS